MFRDTELYSKVIYKEPMCKVKGGVAEILSRNSSQAPVGRYNVTTQQLLLSTPYKGGFLWASSLQLFKFKIVLNKIWDLKLESQ